MEKAVIKIREIEIRNIKNVVYGNIIFPASDKTKKENQSEIIGVYGQNGSGKSALVNCVAILKDIMSGNPLDEETSYYINQDSSEATLSFQFSIEHENQIFLIFYDVKIKKDDKKNPIIYFEKIAYKKVSDENHSKTTIIETTEVNDDHTFLPQYRYEELIKRNKSHSTDLIVSRKIALEKRESFIFRDDSMKIFEDFENEDIRYILKALNFFARLNLFVVQNDHYGIIDANYLIPMTIRLDDKKSIKSGDFPIKFGANKLDKEQFDVFKSIVHQMSNLIKTIIPGMELIYREYGKETSSTGTVEYAIELLSKRGNLEIPIKYESDGIKKIISVLSALIAMYNRESIFVAIDEFDAGIFEYLLGEILKVINDTGKGQLLFTSHNLRALEVLDKDSIYFSTTNSVNKFIRFSNIKNNHNLRNVYLRAIEIGGQRECVYEETNEFDISRAFRMAGRDTEKND